MERKGHIKSAIKEFTNPFPNNYEGKKNSMELKSLYTVWELEIIGFSIKLMKKKGKCTFLIF